MSLPRSGAAPGLVLAAWLALGLAGCGGSGIASGPHFASGHDHDIVLSAGWVSAVGGASGASDGSGMSPMPGMDMSTGSTAYATVADTGSRADALVSVSTSVAGQATLHDTVSSADGSAGTMVSATSVPVAAGGHVTLRPGGYHVMLTDLKSDLKPGTTVTMTWTFRSGAHVTARFPVIDPADRPEAGQ